MKTFKTAIALNRWDCMVKAFFRIFLPLLHLRLHFEGIDRARLLHSGHRFCRWHYCSSYNFMWWVRALFVCLFRVSQLWLVIIFVSLSSRFIKSGTRGLSLYTVAIVRILWHKLHELYVRRIRVTHKCVRHLLGVISVMTSILLILSFWVMWLNNILAADYDFA